MNSLNAFCLVTCLMAVTLSATSTKLKPSQWISPSELEEIPSVDDISFEDLEHMPLEKGAKFLERFYHLSQINHDFTPTFVPSPSNIPVYFVRPNGHTESTTFNQLVSTCKQYPEFGEKEVTFFITGLPQFSETVTKATRKLVNAYTERYYSPSLKPQNYDFPYEEKERTASDESSDEWSNYRPSRGNLVIIDLGSTLSSFKRYAMLDVEQTGVMFGKAFVQMSHECHMPHEIVHIVAQNIAAHVAGALGNEYTRFTGQYLRRISALDPSKLYSKYPHQLTGLARGDAQFVDAIHTSTYGMGTPIRVGDIDFYPGGPSIGVPGVDNVIEASVRATRYFAETVYPGYEHNFPAVAANSLEEYQANNGYGKRTYMGIAADYDLKGDYFLQVSPKSPFGKRTPAQKQKYYHGVHLPWKGSKEFE